MRRDDPRHGSGTKFGVPIKRSGKRRGSLGFRFLEAARPGPLKAVRRPVRACGDLESNLMGVGLSAEGEICYSETAIVRIRVAEVGEMEFLAESRYRTSVVLALFCGMAIAGCGSVGPIAGSAFSGIPAQTEPKVDQADATRSR